jgi:hypothetical protein
MDIELSPINATSASARASGKLYALKKRSSGKSGMVVPVRAAILNATNESIGEQPVLAARAQTHNKCRAS